MIPFFDHKSVFHFVGKPAEAIEALLCQVTKQYEQETQLYEL